jgi:membrane protease YdiL (CAAX protease family)
MAEQSRSKPLWVAAKCAAYVLLVMAGVLVTGQLLAEYTGYLTASILGVFVAATFANFVALHLFERAHLNDVGLAWAPASVRNLLVGLAGGTGAACVVLVGPVMIGWADFQPSVEQHIHWENLAFVMTLLALGAVGEELVFRGYGFQILVNAIGPFATILPVAVLFALAHSSNLNVTLLGLVNTGLWGVLLGWAVIRSCDLWLPIGLHLGWNWAFPLFGVRLSGFTIKVTAYELHWKVGSLWSGGAYGPEGGVLTTAVMAGLAVYLWRAPVRKQTALLMQSLEVE